ncbi:leucyl aminopeptidase [Streptomyces sp. NPDC051976]|uniref:leucyl aminopeptidase n=1 Tax=Streptomyces sp. NPDC051976 TaxID=3154947 RepID=UPI003433056E
MTTLTMSTARPTSLPADAVVIGVVKGPQGPALAPGAEAVADTFDGPLTDSLSALGVTGAEGETVKLLSPIGLKARLVLAVGLGNAPDDGVYDTDALRRAAGVATRTLAGAPKVLLALPADTADAVEAVGLGGLLGTYDFTAYRSCGTGDGKAPVAELVILVGTGADDEALLRACVVGQELNRARDLINMPANDLYPQSFAALVQAAGREHGLTVEVFDENALTEGAFGGILGVGQGSANPPRLVKIAYTHPKADTSLAFVGKGITYDSGGISLKPVGFNEIMKRDMSGAAAVFAAVMATARLGLQVNITGWLAMAENMPSGSATRPGDVLRMYGGKTVEVVNTDAEGRLVLGDALVRAGEDKPDAIVDVATLTGAMVLALGKRTFGVMSNDSAFRDRIMHATKRAGEDAWPMPLTPALRKGLDSTVADIANSGERMGGGLAAGLFLQEFVPDHTPWAHLDIAGPAFHEGEPYGYTPKGGTGSAVRTLIQVALDAAAGGLR